MLEFYNNKRVLVTGHTGFKGSWLIKMLTMAGARVTGFSLAPPTNPSLYLLSGANGAIASHTGDIRDLKQLKKVMAEAEPEIVIHMAAQPLVRSSYEDPVYTYETNVMGTVNILESVRSTHSVKSFLNVTTDKVYLNREWEWGYRENEPLDGYDPYSNSKSCSELVTHSYKNSFFQTREVAVSTARAGNVIGGGDFAKDRIIPDCIRAAMNKETIVVRNPHSIRPYQHVLEPLMVYLTILQKQYEDRRYEGYYNVGPGDADCITTGELADVFCRAWGDNLSWESREDKGPHEASYLKLDCSKVKHVFGWKPVWSVREAIEKTVEWARVYEKGGDISACMENQIREFVSGNTSEGIK